MAINRNVLAEKQATVLSEDGNTMYATIQMRHGKESEMDKSKFVPAEMGVATDTKKMVVAFGPNDTKEVAFKDDLDGLIKKNQGTENSGKVLVVGKDGNVTPGETPIEIDSTLTQSGHAADAKATGDKLSSLSEDLDNERESIKKCFVNANYYLNSKLENGGIDPATGNLVDFNYRARCAEYILVDKNVKYNIEVSDGFKVALIYYNNNKEYTGTSDWINKNFSITLDCKYFKYAVGKQDDSKVSIQEAKSGASVYEELLNPIYIHSIRSVDDGFEIDDFLLQTENKKAKIYDTSINLAAVVNNSLQVNSKGEIILGKGGYGYVFTLEDYCEYKISKVLSDRFRVCLTNDIAEGDLAHPGILIFDNATAQTFTFKNFKFKYCYVFVGFNEHLIETTVFAKNKDGVGIDIVPRRMNINPDWIGWKNDRCAYGFNIDEVPVYNIVEGILESDTMISVGGGKGRWHSLTGNLKYGGHVFEGWNTDETMRLTEIMGKFADDFGCIMVYGPASLNNNIRRFGTIKYGSDEKNQGVNISQYSVVSFNPITLAQLDSDPTMATQNSAEEDIEMRESVAIGTIYYNTSLDAIRVLTKDGWKTVNVN